MIQLQKQEIDFNSLFSEFLILYVFRKFLQSKRQCWEDEIISNPKQHLAAIRRKSFDTFSNCKLLT